MMDVFAQFSRLTANRLTTVSPAGIVSGKTGNEEFWVQDYRIFVVGLEGHIIDRIDLVCASEEDAIERARQVVDGHAVELWRGSRRIERFEPPR